MNLVGFCFCGRLIDANRIGCVFERAVEAITTTHLRVPSIEQQDLCEPSIIIY